MGEGAYINAGGVFIAGNNIEAEWREVVYLHGMQPEDKAQLFFFPVADKTYCVQLCYIIYNSATQTHKVFSFTMLPAFFEQFPRESLLTNPPFTFNTATEQQFTICRRALLLLNELAETEPVTTLAAQLHTAHCAAGLLCRAIEHIAVPFMVCQVPACRFLAYEGEREKISLACGILEQNIDAPHTIKELARKVAMNECYLKKGFKAITGKTIHEYQQELRINKAKELLQQGGCSVTEAAQILGYNSISHFSTAFKRVTGMKPCELLK